MQILDKACMRCAGEFPAFEPEECLNPSPSFVESMKGGAVKILDPFFTHLPTSLDYNFIFMKRDKLEQARSNFKFMLAVGMPVRCSVANIARFAKSIARDEPKALRTLVNRHPRSRILEMDFETLIHSPLTACTAIVDFLGLYEFATAHALIGCVQPRSSDCYEGLLELSQI